MVAVARRPLLVEALGLQGVSLQQSDAVIEDSMWRRDLAIDLPADAPVLFLTLPAEAELKRAMINGELAFDASLQSRRSSSRYYLRIVNPGSETLQISLLTERDKPFTMAAVTWHELPAVLIAPFMGNWPGDAQPNKYGPRAEKIQLFEIR